MLTTRENNGYDLSNVGGRIRWAIDQAGFNTDAAFAKQIGKERAAVSRWINNPERGISEDNLQVIAEATGVTAAWLRYGHHAPVEAHPFQLAPAEVALLRESSQGYDGGFVEELLDLIGVEGGLRRAFREHSPADLIRIVYGVAIDDRWPTDKLAKLDRIRDRILGDEAST